MLFIPVNKYYFDNSNRQIQNKEDKDGNSDKEAIHKRKVKLVKKKKKSQIQKKDDLIPAYKAEDLKLPKRFAEQVLELEMDVEHGIFTLKQIQRLMHLYSKAVEFYNGKSDTKYLFYQTKIQNLITQDKVLDLLSSKANWEVPSTETTFETDPKTKEELKKKERLLKMNLHMSNQEQVKANTKTKIIEDHTSAQDKVSKIVENNLNDQTTTLSQRLAERRNRLKKTQAQPETLVEPLTEHLTNSSTPNLNSCSKNDNNESPKENTSEEGSEEDEWFFRLDMNSLAEEGFSDELMNKLKLLQDGYDENDYDDDQLFDEEVVEKEIENILTKWDEEVEHLLEEDQNKIEELYEQMADEKFEKIAEIKSEYQYRIKKCESEEEKAELISARDQEIKEINQKYLDLKNQRVKELKTKNKEKIKIKRENIKKVITKVRRSVSRKASRRASGKTSPRGSNNFEEDRDTIRLSNMAATTTKEKLEETISKGLNTKNEFSESFKISKGPINMNTLVVRAETENDNSD